MNWVKLQNKISDVSYTLQQMYITHCKLLPWEKIRLSEKTKSLFNEYILSDSLSKKEIQKIADSICEDCNVRPVRVELKGDALSREKEGKKICLGFYRYSFNRKRLPYIRIYETWNGRKTITKDILYILLHEIAHHFDYHIMGIESKHSIAFYLRIQQIGVLLENPSVKIYCNKIVLKKTKKIA